MSKIIELAKKLQALADRGVGGEKLNAEQKLKELCQKYNISLEDLESEKEDVFSLKIEDYTLLGDRLAWQIIVKFDLKAVLVEFVDIEPSELKALKSKDKDKMEGNTHFIYCTPSVFVEFETLFSTYFETLKKDMQMAYLAFLMKNELLLPAKDDSKPTTKEDLKAYQQAKNMAKNMTKANPRKQLT